MREIEIKCRVANRTGLLAALDRLGISLSEPKKQHDVVYGEPGAKDNSLDANWLRIRTENDKVVYFTLKRSVVGHLDSIEHETIVDNAAELQAIIELLGFELYSDLTKTRQKGGYEDIEVCVDEVPGLGSFIEAELMMEHDSDHDVVVARLWDFFDQLGLDKADEVHEGYDVLERRLRGF